MGIYKVTLYNDMGHLVNICKYNNQIITMSSDLLKFVYSKINNKYYTATDKKGFGAQYYILKSGLNKNWSYNYKNHTIQIEYDLDKFNPTIMKLLQ